MTDELERLRTPSPDADARAQRIVNDAFKALPHLNVDPGTISELSTALVTRIARGITASEEERDRWHRVAMDAGVIVCADGRLMFTAKARAEKAEVARLTKERDEARSLTIEFRQHDWIPGFAAFHANATTPQGQAFCVINLGSILATVEAGHVPAADVPYFIAESMMHEIMHALEQWAGVEFSEERVEALLEKYRADAAIRSRATSSREADHG